MGELECLGNEFLPAGGAPAGRTQESRAVVQCLVDHVPHGDAAAVTADHRVDMRLHAPEKLLAAGGLGAVAIKPRRRAVILGPDQAVADNLKMVRGGESHERIGLGEVELALRRLHRIGLEAILRRHRIELHGEQRPICRPFRDTIADAGADGKQPGGSISQRVR